MRKLFKFLLIAALIVLVACLFWDSFFHEQVDLYNYPIKYSELIEKYSAEHGVPREIVYAVVHTESRFTPDALSHAGAKGLMQLMDVTNEWIAFVRREEVMPERMLEPEFNIDRGTWLLAYLYDEFGSWEEALAAYNAGIGRVRGWLADKRYSSDGEVLHTIPFEETKEYVRRVMFAAEKYRELYFENN